MFKNYKEEGIISGIRNQHNIMFFVGNGFDISVLKKYRNDGLISSYKKFFDFLSYKGVDEANILYKRMQEDKDQGKENWSDFENTLDELLRTHISVNELENALKEMQMMFLLFLNEIVMPEILLKLNVDTVKNQWTNKALSCFLGDLDRDEYEKMKFPETTDHYDMYNFLFVNFNYTSLLDDYMFLDKSQFDPHPHKSVDTNHKFYPNPNGFSNKGLNERTVWSSFLMLDIIHPHGYQSIPRSLLFGIEIDECQTDKAYKQFAKSYWTQSNQKYKSYFDNADLFIIYGSSIGMTDNWWWKQIYDCLLKGKSELIIYYYSDKAVEKDIVKQMFIQACKIEEIKDEEAIKERIYVVLYNDDIPKIMFTLRSNENNVE